MKTQAIYPFETLVEFQMKYTAVAHSNKDIFNVNRRAMLQLRSTEVVSQVTVTASGIHIIMV
jgi:hypothetical protein